MITLLVILLIANGGLPSMKDAGAMPIDLPPGSQVVFHVAQTMAKDRGEEPPFSRVEDRVVLTLDGTLHNPPIPVDAADAGSHSPAAMVSALREAALDGEANRAMSLYLPSERPGMRALWHDTRYREQQRLRALELSSTAIRAQVQYGDYTLVLVEHNDGTLDNEVLAMMMVNGRWLCTNSLTSDAVFDQVLTAFILGDYGPATAPAPAAPAPAAPAQDAAPKADTPRKSTSGAPKRR